jgi:hypothetical protein
MIKLSELLGKYIEVKLPESETDGPMYFYLFNVTDITDDMIKADVIIGIDDIGAIFENDLDAFDSEYWIIKEFANKESLLNQSLVRLKEFIYNKFDS